MIGSLNQLREISKDPESPLLCIDRQLKWAEAAVEKRERKIGVESLSECSSGDTGNDDGAPGEDAVAAPLADLLSDPPLVTISLS